MVDDATASGSRLPEYASLRHLLILELALTSYVHGGTCAPRPSSVHGHRLRLTGHHVPTVMGDHFEEELQGHSRRDRPQIVHQLSRT